MGICEPTLNMRKRGYITRVRAINDNLGVRISRFTHCSVRVLQIEIAAESFVLLGAWFSVLIHEA